MGLLIAGLLDRVRHLATKNGFGAIALIVTVGMGAYLRYQGHDLRTTEAPSGIVSLELACAASKAADIIRSWAGDKHQIAVDQVLFDFIFILGYACFGLYLGFKAADRARGRGVMRLARAAAAAGIGALAAGVLDCLENIGLLLMLGGHVSPATAFFTSLFATTKFALLAVAAIVVLAAALWPAARLAPG